MYIPVWGLILAALFFLFFLVRSYKKQACLRHCYIYLSDWIIEQLESLEKSHPEGFDYCNNFADSKSEWQKIINQHYIFCKRTGSMFPRTNDKLNPNYWYDYK